MKILSLGAVLLDQIASVDRFPNEDDEVFVPKLQLLPGGSAANFAVMCARLGAQAGFVGKVGNDSFGDFLIDDLKKEKVDVGGITRSALPTGTAFIAVRTDGQREMFAHSGSANDLKDSEVDMNYMNNFDHMHLADLENIPILLHAAKKFKGTKSLSPGALIADKPAAALDLIKHVDILICSEGEALRISGKTAVSEALAFLSTIGPKVVVITRGSRGSIALAGKQMAEVPVFNVTVVDATGAGDSFSAGFVYNYLKTKNLKESLRFANAAASIVIQHPGARGGLKNLAQVESLLR